MAVDARENGPASSTSSARQGSRSSSKTSPTAKPLSFSARRLAPCTKTDLSLDGYGDLSGGRAYITNRAGNSLAYWEKCEADRRTKMLCRLAAIVVLALLLPTQLTGYVGAAALGCQNASFVPFGSYCYQVFQTQRNFFTANTICRSYSNGYLSDILSQAELTFLQELAANKTANNRYQMWVGLTDQYNEGIYTWNHLGPQAPPANINPNFWAQNEPMNTGTYQDCVTLQSDGLHMAEVGCSEDTGLFFICKQASCLEGGCGAAAQTGASAATTTTIAVVIVVLAVVILVIVGLLLYTWKYHNDKWELYVCYICKMRESKTQVHSLQQENQRLRRQLSNHRSTSQISLTGLNNDKGGMAGPSDGNGGVLPTIRPLSQLNKMPSSGSLTSPPTSPGGPRGPPPLRRQNTSQMSTGPMLTRNMSNMSMGNPQYATSPMSRQSSVGLMNNMRGRVMPGSLGGEPPSPTKFGAVNPPRAAFVNMPTYPSSASITSGRGPPSRSTSVANAFDLVPPSPRKKVSTVAEDPDGEDAEQRPGSQTSLPGEIEEE